MDELQKQIEAQWRAYGINPDIKGINRANELAQILSNYGITDLSKLGIKETPYEEMRGNWQGGESGEYVEALHKGNRGQLTYGDQTFGRLGGFGSKGQQEFAAPQEFLQEAGDGRYGLGYSAAGKGWTEFEVVAGPDGKPVIVPRWGSSSDLTPELVQFLSIAAMPFTGGLSSSLGSALGSQVAGQIASQALISGGLGGLSSAAQGGSFGKGFGRGAVAGGLGAAAGPYLGALGSEASKLVGGGNFGDIVSGAVQGAGRGAVGAVITGDSVLDAILTGAAGGAASAGTDILVKGTNSTLGQYLKDVPAPIKNAVLSAASAGILGKDIDKAVVNSFMRELQGTVKAAGKDAISGKAASAGYGGADQGYFDEANEVMGLPAWAIDPYKTDTTSFTPGSDDVYEDIESLLARYTDQGSASTPTGEADQTITTTGRLDKDIPDRDILPDAVVPRSIRDVGNVTKVSPDEKLEGTDIAVPDLSKNLPTVQSGTKTGTKTTTKPAASGGLDLSALAFLLGMSQQRPEEEEQQATSPFPEYEELMYGLKGRYA